LAIAVIGGLLSSMVLSLVFTPAIHAFLQGTPRKQIA
jgi:Cu/Ag efflux pump CusA